MLSRSVLLGIGCMRSGTKPVGTAQVGCVAGCTCNETVLDAAWDQPVSLTSIFSVPVKMTSDECVLHFQVRPSFFFLKSCEILMCLDGCM
jgi:hypothetical protein